MGWLAGVLGVQKGPVEPWIPVLIFAVVFGLSMDCEVFLVSRVREQWVRERDASRAVADGISFTGRVITAAAAIMVCVFLSFMLGNQRTIKEFGFGLAFAVFIDALVVRCVLLPARVRLVAAVGQVPTAFVPVRLAIPCVIGRTAGTNASRREDMDFELSDRAKDLREQLLAFMDEYVYPAEPVWADQVRSAATAHTHAPVIEELKAEAKRRGLWNLFLPDSEFGAGLSNCDYAPLAEIMGRTKIASEACNCNAPDTGNMEVLHQFGSPEQKERWLMPLLEGEIRSAFAMTEPEVASSDATNIGMRIERHGHDYLLTGRKWWTTNALHPNLRILIVLGKTDPSAPAYQQQSMILVPVPSPGLEIVRDLPVFGYHDTEGHGELSFADVRVPAENIIAGEGMGFLIAQARLGPGRIHHCMRAIGAAERAIELMCRRADERETFGKPIAHNSNVRDWIAESRIELEMARLMVMKTAWLMDTVGNQHARIEISGIKFAVPQICLRILDRAIQVHGGGGVSDDFPLAMMWAYLRTLRLVDGPDEVHKLSLARQELRRQRDRRGASAAG